MLQGLASGSEVPRSCYRQANFVNLITTHLALDVNMGSNLGALHIILPMQQDAA